MAETMSLRVACRPLLVLLSSLWFWGLVSCVPVPETVAVEDPSSSPLTVAHCRVNCLIEFDGTVHRDASCMQNPDCFSCWQNCEVLHANLSNWNGICSEKTSCFPGCRAACRFFDTFRTSPQQQRQQVPVLETNTADLLVTAGPELRWPRPPLTSGVVVYVVMWRPNDTARWAQVTQTLERKARLPADTGGSARVLVVDPGGLRTVYSPAGARQPAPTDIEAIPVALREGGLPVLMGAPGGWVLPTQGIWSVRVLSLIHQGVLVIAELSWRVPQQEAGRPIMAGHQYLVTWAVDGGGITGNLLTDSTCVTLSLWPDTVFQIQVELVSRRLPITRSQPLVVNTGRLLVAEPPGARSQPVWLHGPLGPVLFATFKSVVALLALFICFWTFLWRNPQPDVEKAALVIDVSKHDCPLHSHWNGSDEEAEPLPKKSDSINV